MANERITEDIVREHFRQFGDAVTVEEQSSSDARVQKLLRGASKSGPGRGRPEFIVRFSDEAAFVAVVECKADPARHESPGGGHPAGFAVDGVLRYAECLSSEFDVLAIAVGGTDEASLRVSHYLWMSSESEPREHFGDRLLTCEDYLSGYRQDPVKFRQDYRALQSHIRTMNDRLHTNKVAEKNRALLLSAVIMALEREAFRASYKSEKNAKALAESIVSTVINQMEEAGISGDRLDVLNQKFGFLPLETQLLQGAGASKSAQNQSFELRDIVMDVDAEISSFVKTHKYRDVLGALYIEFLRHANSDKGLGIVLTPPHITDFFAELARVDAESIVYDNCVGTGGFLISAMKKMIKEAGGSQEIEARIKARHLYGVEVQADIYPLAVSNMFIHQDGKSNIEWGDCFDAQIKTRIRKRRPNVGLLNPPYKSNKKTDTDELRFVLNNLEALAQGGVCVAIVPMQCAIGQGRTTVELRRQLLSRHTLRAVLSMPDELFFNSKVGVVSCIMVFEAGRAHPEEQEVFLGYFKDDGFKKSKPLGRHDATGQWETIQKEWLELYQNKRSMPGYSVNVRLTSRQEWAAEAYMQTDYSRVTGAMFDETLHNYSAYLFANRLVGSVSDQASSGVPVTLDPSLWKPYPLVDLFTISGTVTTPLRELRENEPGGGDTQPTFPYVTTQATNNGVAAFFPKVTEDGNVLTVDSAVVGYCSYQANKFSASDHVEKLTPRFNMDAHIAMFLVTIINLEQYRYNYGRKCSQTRLRQASICLPAAADGPDYDYMREYIQSRPYSSTLAASAGPRVSSSASGTSTTTK